MCVISAYAPEEGKPAHKKYKFYEDLLGTFCRISDKENIILIGALNAWIRNYIVPGTV